MKREEIDLDRPLEMMRLHDKIYSVIKRFLLNFYC